MGFVVGFSKPGWDCPYYLTRFIKDGDGFRPVGTVPPQGCPVQVLIDSTRALPPCVFPFRSAWFIAQNMRRVGYQAEVQYVK